MTQWGDGFAEGDSGYYAPGQAVKLWREIEDAEKELANRPKRFRRKTLAEVQADVLKIAEDLDNDAATRVTAYQLAYDMARDMADAGVDPVSEGAGNGE